MLDDLADFIASSGYGVVGQNIFENYMPDKLDNCVYIRDTSGFVPDGYIPTYSPSFQVIVRNTSASAGRTMAFNIRDLFHRRANATIGTTYFYYILAMQEPGSIGKDSSGRYEWTQNFQCKIRGLSGGQILTESGLGLLTEGA